MKSMGGIRMQSEGMDIRSFFATGFYTQKELGEFYGVTQRHVSDIVNGKTWMKDIPQGA